MIYPSKLAHIMNGLLLLFAILYGCYNYEQLKDLDTYSKLVLILLCATVVGIHGISHLGLEHEYNYVPFDMYKIKKNI